MLSELNMLMETNEELKQLDNVSSRLDHITREEGNREQCQSST